MSQLLAWIGGIAVVFLFFRFLYGPLLMLFFPQAFGRTFFRQRLIQHGVDPSRVGPRYIEDIVALAWTVSSHAGDFGESRRKVFIVDLARHAEETSDILAGRERHIQWEALGDPIRELMEEHRLIAPKKTQV